MSRVGFTRELWTVANNGTRRLMADPGEVKRENGQQFMAVRFFYKAADTEPQVNVEWVDMRLLFSTKAPASKYFYRASLVKNTGTSHGLVTEIAAEMVSRDRKAAIDAAAGRAK